MFENESMEKIVKKRKNEMYDLYFEFERTSTGKVFQCFSREDFRSQFVFRLHIARTVNR